MKLMILVGSGRKIALFSLPFVIAGVVLNLIFPDFFAVGGPAPWLFTISCLMLVPGIAVWLWTVYLILTKIPARQLITTGPYSIVKHPLYTGVSFLVMPWAGFLFNTWLGLFIGLVFYLGSRLYSTDEERILAKIFGESWESYCSRVVFKWL